MKSWFGTVKFMEVPETFKFPVKMTEHDLSEVSGNYSHGGSTLDAMFDVI